MRDWVSQMDRGRFLRVSGGVLAAGLSADVLAACGGEDEPEGQSSGQGRTLTIGVAGDPETLDPAWGQALRANETIKNLYAQWVKYKVVDSGEGYMKADLPNVEGEAIESFSIEPDNVTVRFKVRDAKFPDGTPITADDFIFKLQRSVGVNAGSAWVFNTAGGVTDPKKHIEKVSDREFLFRLAAPAPILGPMLRDQDASIEHTSLVKEHITADDKWAEKWMARNGAPSGAYVLDRWTRGTRLVLRANPNYWEKPYFNRVVLQIIPSAEDRVLLLRNGSIDIAEDLSIDAISRLKDVEGVRVISVPSITQDVLGFVMDKPPFDDVRVRQAIAHGIPYDALARDVLHGEAQVPKGVWPQNSIWFADAPWPYANDPERAKGLLAQAGHDGGLSFTVELREGDADAEALAVPIQTELRNIGVEMDIRKLAPAQFQGNLGKRSMQAWIQSALGSYVDDPYYQAFLWYASDAVINWFKYSNPTVDKVTAELKTEVDEDGRRTLARQLQEQLNKDVPAISLAEPNFLIPMRDDIDGYLYEPDGLVTYRLLKRKT